MPYRTTSGTISLSLAVFFLASATAVGADDAIASRFADAQAFRQFVVEGRTAPLGLDYVFVHSPGARDQELVDAFCAKVPVRWVNLTRLEWKVIERQAPVAGRHTYNWHDLDKAVQTWQRNGVHLMVSMRFESPWATAQRSDREFIYLKGLAKQVALHGADYLPKPEHQQDLREYMQAVVERYDGDGKHDMPGLLFPVLHYQIGNEYYNEVFWAGSAQEYGQLLREAARGVRAACADVQIVLSGIGFSDVYGFYDVAMDSRTESYVRQLLPKVPANMRPFVGDSEAFSRASASFTSDYDILDARWPNYGIVAKSRELLRQLGAGDKPVWSAEIYSGFPLLEPLVLPNWTLQAWPTPSRSRDYLKVLKRKDDPQFEEINTWYRALQAAHVVKLCMVALDAGSQKLMMGWAIDAQHPLAISTLSHHGLYSATFKQLWPAGYTYGLLIRKLDGLQRVQRQTAPENCYVYRCTLEENRQLLVVFYDDHIGQNHNEPTASAELSLRVPWSRARITHIITQVGQTESVVETVRPTRGRLVLTATEYPVFVEPAEQ